MLNTRPSTLMLGFSSLLTYHGRRWYIIRSNLLTVASQTLLLDFRSWFPPCKITFLRTFFDFLFPNSVLYSQLRKQCADQIPQSAQVSSASFLHSIIFRAQTYHSSHSLLNVLALRARMFFYSIQFIEVYS